MIRSLIEDAYKKGRSDGSRYGSIGGSQIIRVEGSHTPSPTTSQLVRDQQGINDPSMLWDETDVNFPPLPEVPPLRRDSEDSRAADFVGEDLTTNADYQPEDLRPAQTQPNQPNIRVQEDVQTNPDPTATPGAACLGPAGHTAATTEQTIEDKIRTFHIPDDPPSSQSQTAPPTQIPD
jgi:hypothetical protein